MSTYEVSRTLLKSAPELWAALEGDRLEQVVGEVSVRATRPERELRWEADGAAGTARLEPAGWGTKVTLTAEVEDAVARLGIWDRMRGVQPPAPPHPDIERRLSGLLDELGADHHKPFTRD